MRRSAVTAQTLRGEGFFMLNLTRQPSDGRAGDETLADLIDHATAALRAASRVEVPFRHWLFRDVLADPLCRSLVALPVPPPPIADTHGKRDSYNEQRHFSSLAYRHLHPTLDPLPPM